jgi:hypothetical protein
MYRSVPTEALSNHIRASPRYTNVSVNLSCHNTTKQGFLYRACISKIGKGELPSLGAWIALSISYGDRIYL